MTVPAPSSRRFLNALADGDSVEETFLVVDKQLRANRNGNQFLQLELRDRTGSMAARLWNAGEPLFRTFEVGDFLFIKGKVQLFQGALQMILHHIERVPGETVSLVDFLPHTTKDIGKLFESLRQHIRKLGNPHLRALGDCFLLDEAIAQGLCQAPAGVRNHHAYVGGLLEHIVTLLDAGDRLAPLYPELDRDLFLMGLFLHDIGKVRELSYTSSFAYTDEGQLIGHLVIGVEMLAAKAAEASRLTGQPFPQELLLRLKHILLSHHGTHEFGSPRVPMTPEAIAVHLLDNFDAKLHTFVREIRDDTSSNSWTAFNQSLQRRLFKGGTGPTSNEEEEDE